jgi:hypothetical protein
MEIRSGDRYRLAKVGGRVSRHMILLELFESEDLAHGTGYSNGRVWICEELPAICRGRLLFIGLLGSIVRQPRFYCSNRYRSGNLPSTRFFYAYEELPPWFNSPSGNCRPPPPDL